MSTQRRVARLQRFLNTKPTGVAESSSQDEAIAVSKQQFRRVSNGLTALSGWSLYSRTWDVTNSLSFSSRCEWRSRHGSNETPGEVLSKSRAATAGGFFPECQAGSFPQQLPIISPLLSSAFQRRRLCLGSCEPGAPEISRSVQSALPQVPMGVGPGTERQHGQGNLYLQHATRNAACNSGRRSARRDLLRAGK